MKKTQLVIPNDIRYLDILFSYLDGIFARLGFDFRDKNKLKLAAEETISNIIHYSFDDDEEQDITISCSIESGSLVISIKDMGMPVDPSLMPEYNPINALEHADQLSNQAI